MSNDLADFIAARRQHEWMVQDIREDLAEAERAIAHWQARADELRTALARATEREKE